MTTPETTVLELLRARGADEQTLSYAMHHIAGKKSAGPFCIASARALLVVAAMESGIRFPPQLIGFLAECDVTRGRDTVTIGRGGYTPFDTLVRLADALAKEAV